jgi:hypothetical protein
VHDNGEVKGFLRVDAKEVLADGKVAAAADGQVFRQALDDTEY